MSGTTRDVPGTILRGPDGNLYFIPDSALPKFRIFDNHVDRVEQLFAGGALGGGEGDAEAPPLTNAEGDTVHGGIRTETVYATLKIVDADPSDEAVSFQIIAMALSDQE